jgi:hypothetical protein
MSAKLPAHDLPVIPSMFVEHFKALAALPEAPRAVGVLHMAIHWPRRKDAVDVSGLGPLPARADALILPHDQQFCRHHGPGMAWQAIGARAPIVGPAGTTVSRLIHDTATGTLFNVPTCADILEAVHMLARNFTAIAKQCHAGAVARRQQQGAPVLVDQMLSTLPTD